MMAADGSGWKRTDLGRQRCEGSRDGRRMRATPSSRQEASRREVKGADTKGRHQERGGPQQARQTLWRESGASGCTRHKRRKAKKAREIREDRTPGVDAIGPEAGSVRPEKKGFLLMLMAIVAISGSDRS